MKNYLSILTATVLFVAFSCQQTTNVDKEKEAVLKVLQEEGDQFAARNKEKVFDIHIQDETATRVGGSTVYSGWEAIKEMYESAFSRNQADTTSENIRNLKENAIVKVNGNTAWVVCDNIWKWDVRGQPGEFQNKQIAVLEKQGGQWKFALNAFVENQNSSQNLLGAWQMVEVTGSDKGEPISISLEGAGGSRIKMWTNNHFSFVGARPGNNGKTIDSYGGGTYTLAGNRYEEDVIYNFNKLYVGVNIKMLLEIKNDTLFQTYPVDSDGNIDKNNYAVEKYVRLD